MTYIPITPFGRTVDAAVIAHHRHGTSPLPSHTVNKWEILRELGVAGRRFGVGDRELAVLQTLLGFHPHTDLGGEDADLVVFPSNRAICERMNGIACSTMRRHLAGLVKAGLILRRDSPNGKRFVRRYDGEPQAFGFDLTPLLTRHAEICAAAEEIRAETEALERLRRTVSLMRRDLAGLALYGSETRPDLTLWDAFSDLATLTARALRRKLSNDELKALEAKLAAALDTARDAIDGLQATDSSTNDARNERHHQNSNKDAYASEASLEKEPGEPAMPDPHDRSLPNIPLGLVLAHCSEIRTYHPDPIRHWHQLVNAADIVRPMMGISPSAWADAVEAMGPEEAAVTVVAMLERFHEIKSPGGYLRHLARKAAEGNFSCGPMIMALMRKEAA